MKKPSNIQGENQWLQNKFNIENVIRRAFFGPCPPGASDVIKNNHKIVLAFLAPWKFPRTTKILSELYTSFWNDFHMRTSIFVHEIDKTQKEDAISSFKFEEFSAALRKILTPNIKKLVKPKQTQKFP